MRDSHGTISIQMWRANIEDARIRRRKFWKRRVWIDPNVNTHSESSVNVAWLLPTLFPQKLHYFFFLKELVGLFQIAQVRTRYLNSRLHKRLCVSLTQRMLAREKGYARLLLPLASQNEGDDQDESPWNKEDRRLVDVSLQYVSK